MSAQYKFSSYQQKLKAHLDKLPKQVATELRRLHIDGRLSAGGKRTFGDDLHDVGIRQTAVSQQGQVESRNVGVAHQRDVLVSIRTDGNRYILEALKGLHGSEEESFGDVWCYLLVQDDFTDEERRPEAD